MRFNKSGWAIGKTGGKENNMLYTIINKPVRVAIEVYSTETWELLFTRYCDIDNVAAEIGNIHKSQSLGTRWTINRTYLCDDAGREYQGTPEGGTTE